MVKGNLAMDMSFIEFMMRWMVIDIYSAAFMKNQIAQKEYV